MELRADFATRAVVAFDEGGLVGSPAGGVARFMLDRIGAEVARATSICRFAPGATFSPHSQGGGEEVLVLEGVFSDAYGDFPAGSYVRNPVGSSHTPGSKGGCTIFVKLWQMNPAEQVATRLTADEVAAATAAGQALYEDARERVAVQELAQGQSLVLDWPWGGELLVLGGQLETSGDSGASGNPGSRLGRWDWLRLPARGAALRVEARAKTRLWLKQRLDDRSGEAWALRGV